MIKDEGNQPNMVQLLSARHLLKLRVSLITWTLCTFLGALAMSRGVQVDVVLPVLLFVVPVTFFVVLSLEIPRSAKVPRLKWRETLDLLRERVLLEARDIVRKGDVEHLERQIHAQVAIAYGYIDYLFEQMNKAEVSLNEWAEENRPEAIPQASADYLDRFLQTAVYFYEEQSTREEGLRVRKVSQKSDASRARALRLRVRSSPRADRSREYLENVLLREARVLARAEYDRIWDVEEEDVAARARELAAQHARDLGLEEEWIRWFESSPNPRPQPDRNRAAHGAG